MEKDNSTKIIKTFRGEVIFLITFVIFISGILGAYYRLVQDVAVMKNEQSNQTNKMNDFINKFDQHLVQNNNDHDTLVRVKTRLDMQ